MTFEEFRKCFPIQLNAQQLAAVQAIDRPTLLLAVPGSGKTTVLVARLGYMIYCCGIVPESILTVTYTVAATADMRERFAGYFGEELAGRLEFRTINGICARIIAYYGRLIGKTPYQLLNDEKQIAAILSQIFQQVEGEYATESDLKTVRTYLTYIKNRMLNQEQIRELEEEAGVRLEEIYQEYNKQLKARGAMDYDDQMVYAYSILRRSPEVLQYFQRCYPYICVDEAQDTSRIQHEIIALLASGEDRLFMVGDEDQSIYGFRAAYPEALLHFETNHPGAQILFMEENFRSNAHIVAAADRFIRLNTKRREKHMLATKAAQAQIREIELKGRRAQYSYLVKVAADCVTQTAVLYRNHESVIPLVDLLERSGIPYRLRNADPTFFSHRVVQDLVNIIRFAYAPEDTELFLQIYYKLSTFLSRKAALQICEISVQKKLPVLETALHHAGLTGNEKKNLAAIRTHLQHMRKDSAQLALNRITQYMGYGDYLERTQMSDSKLFVLKTLAAGVETPLAFVERIGQLQEIMKNKNSEEDCPFILSTIHASKGLEYDTVYLLDVQDGLFPESIPKNLKRADPKELDDYEEERRLFYVAVTRAREQLILFGLGGKSVFREQLMGRVSAQTIQQTAKQSAVQESLSKKQSQALAEVEFRKFTELLGEGLLVEHKKFGAGVVTTVTQKRVAIRFADREREFDLRLLFKSQLLQPEVL